MGTMDFEEGSAGIGMESEARSDLARASKLLLVEGVLEGGVGFLPDAEGFLLCLLREGTLVKPSASGLTSASLF